MCKKYVQISGPSGIGKTTLAKALPKYLNMENELNFVSSSMSDLVPDTKNVSHLDMLSKDSRELYMQDAKLLNLRSKLYRSYIDEGNDYITDRGYLDLATYFFLKQSKYLPDCEMEHFLGLCLNLLFKHCNRLIILGYTPKDIDWSIENNNKRITSRYFQMQVYHTIEFLLNLWGFKVIKQDRNIVYGYLFNSNKESLRVLIIDELYHDKRLRLCGDFIKSPGKDNITSLPNYGEIPVEDLFDNSFGNKWDIIG